MGDRFEAIVTGLPDGVLVLDDTDTIVFANDAARRFFALENEPLEGSPAARLLPAELGADFHRRLLEHEAPVRAPALRGDQVQIDVAYTAYPIEGDKLVCVLSQLGESVDFENEPVDDTTSHQLVFENAPIGILHFDHDGRITACNDRFVDILGSSKRVLIGLNMQTLPNEEIRACVAEAIEGRRAHYEGDYRSATSGKVTPARVDFVPIFSPDDTVLGGVGIVEDVTERREAERALVRAERMASLGTLAAGIAHEINTPLTYAMASAELLERQLIERGELSPELRASIENVREGTERVRSIVRDVRSFAQSGEERRRPLDLVPVLEAAISLAKPEIRHRARLERDYGATPPVWGTESRLVQVFVNLLANSAQAIEEGDADDNTIRITTAIEGDNRITISIEDTGSGIEPADVDRVFEPFFTRKDGGTGLGLAICHGIVMSLGGDIRVQSSPSRGSVFTVELPVARGEVASGHPPPRRSGAGGRLLVVDDEPRLVQTFQLALEPDYEVVTATSGREALEILSKDDNFDVVLCDLMIPDLDASEIYAQIEHDRPELARRFVFMTGGAFTKRAQAFLARVDNPRLEKPFPIEVLEQMLSERSEAAE